VKEKTVKEVLTIHFEPKDVKDIEADVDVISLYEELVMTDDIDADLDKSHVMYSFCVMLGTEFEHQANKTEAKLEAWSGERWRKYKNSVSKKYTDNDAKRKIESDPHYLKAKIQISKYRKLSKQLIFGGGKALELKSKNLSSRIYREYKALMGDFNVRGEDSKDVGSFIKERIKAKRRK